MGKVWDLDLPADEKLTLLALADHADHDGGNAHPGVELLARKTGYSVRQIQYVLKKLRDRNLICPIDSSAGGRGHTTTYQLFPETAQDVHPLSAVKDAHSAPIKRLNGARPAPIDEPKGCNPRQERVQSTTIPPDPPIRNNRHEPSEEVRHTHTQPLNTRYGSQRDGVCKSFYEIEICIEYARAQSGINNPVALGKSIWRDGTADREIKAWLSHHQETDEERYARIANSI